MNANFPSASVEGGLQWNQNPALNLKLPLAKEPTLEELATFSETMLRGKRAVLHASENSTFARHLTSYLTSWGMDVGHLSTEGGSADGLGLGVAMDVGGSVSAGGLSGSRDGTSPPGSDGSGNAVIDPVSAALLAPGTPDSTGPNGATSAANGAPSGTEASTQQPGSDDLGGGGGNGDGVGGKAVDPSFIIIDDDVDVLRRILNRYRPEMSPALQKRPSLLPHHRPRSSPQMRQVLGIVDPSSSGSSRYHRAPTPASSSSAGVGIGPGGSATASNGSSASGGGSGVELR